MATAINPDSEPVPKPEAAANNVEVESVPRSRVIYRCKKCRRILASDETIVTHERGAGEKAFKWNKWRTDISESEPPECSSIFVEPMKWMSERVEEGYVGDKLWCIGCKARLGSFNWAGMQCNCGTWVNPAFKLHKNRIDECRM